jgi:hypothetical protein
MDASEGLEAAGAFLNPNLYRLDTCYGTRKRDTHRGIRNRRARGEWSLCIKRDSDTDCGLDCIRTMREIGILVLARAIWLLIWLLLCGYWAVLPLQACGANSIPQPSASIGRFRDQSIDINLPLHILTSSGQLSNNPLDLRSATRISASIGRTSSEPSTIMTLLSGMKPARREDRPYHKIRTSLVSGAETSSSLQGNTISRMTSQSNDEMPAGVYPSIAEREVYYIAATQPPGGTIVRYRLCFAEQAYTETLEKVSTVLAKFRVESH